MDQNLMCKTLHWWVSQDHQRLQGDINTYIGPFIITIVWFWPHGPFISMISIFQLIHLNRLKWTMFSAFNYSNKQICALILYFLYNFLEESPISKYLEVLIHNNCFVCLLPLENSPIIYTNQVFCCFIGNFLLILSEDRAL